MWFNVVCTFIDNDTRHHSGQNLLRTYSADPCESTTFWPLWWRVSLLIKVHTTLNHIWFVNYNITKGKCMLWLANQHLLLAHGCMLLMYSIAKSKRVLCDVAQFVADSLGCASWVHNILTTVMTRIVVDKSADHAKPHSICFLPQYQR